MSSSGNPELEILAVSSLVFNEEVGEFLHRLEPRWLSHEPAKRAWKEAVSWYKSHRESIPREVLRERVPQFKFRAGNCSIEGVLEDLQNRYLRLKMEQIYEDEIVSLEEPGEALSAILSRLGTLQAGIQRDTGSDCSETIEEAFERYEDREANKGALGLPFPWAPLQRVTNGAKSGDYILIYSRSKQMKTFILVYVLVHWVKVCKRKVLLITREMTKHQVQDRFFCMWAKVDYGKFRKGDLTKEEKFKLKCTIGSIKKTGKFIIETVESHGAEAATEIMALCEQYGLEEDDVAAVDGMNWFSENSAWESGREFSKGMKSVAVGGQINGNNQRPLVVIGTGHANQNYSDDANADAGKEMSGGDGAIRDVDLALKLRLNKEDHEMRISTAVIREGEDTSFTINAIPCTDYSLKYSDEPEEDDKVDVIPAPVVGMKKQKKGSKGKKGVKGKKGRKGSNDVRSNKAPGLDPNDVVWPGAGGTKKKKKGRKGAA